MSAQFETADAMRRHYARIRGRFWPKPSALKEAPRDVLAVASHNQLAVVDIRHGRRKVVHILYPSPIGPVHPETVSIPRTTGPQYAKRTVKEVAEKHGLTVEDIVSDRRNQKIVAARHEVMWLIHRNTTWSLPRIGSFLGGRDHTTALHGVRKHQAKVDRGEA